VYRKKKERVQWGLRGKREFPTKDSEGKGSVFHPIKAAIWQKGGKSGEKSNLFKEPTKDHPALPKKGATGVKLGEGSGKKNSERIKPTRCLKRGRRKEARAELKTRSIHKG